MPQFSSIALKVSQLPSCGQDTERLRSLNGSFHLVKCAELLRRVEPRKLSAAGAVGSRIETLIYQPLEVGGWNSNLEPSTLDCVIPCLDISLSNLKYAKTSCVSFLFIA